MELSLLLAFLATNFLLNITPGPAVLQVVGHSLGNGWRRTQASIFGILAANAMYCMMSALGLSALILAAPSLFDIIKWCGAGYLVWIGVRTIVSALRQNAVETMPGRPASWFTLFKRSFLLQGANPKSVLFFCAMLPTFAGPADGAPQRIFLLGLCAIALEYPVLLAYSLLGWRMAGITKGAAARRTLGIASGLSLIGAASLVARTSLHNK
ncbi:MAG TPA: LysE family translocator [Noviherbaspirillum sp.]|jgi:threonine/homoserine/homoserine lactone efflux protein|uniref:LysE family translocator n=1 Tax=Noviherbaspirillum sp. TaxID=1926288 RepID=UPI002DDDAC06|nr:LysE family translocator [Noviherbaspirillum sp.]HEV2610063.1 LysE family translocator [Noviherbaspirillum sp.]